MSEPIQGKLCMDISFCGETEAAVLGEYGGAISTLDMALREFGFVMFAEDARRWLDCQVISRCVDRGDDGSCYRLRYSILPGIEVVRGT